jgi:alpha-L-rhamnosidase
MTKHPGYELTGEGRTPVEVSEVSEKIFIERELSLPEYPYEPHDVIYEHGDVTVREAESHSGGREYHAIDDPVIDGYRFEELELIPVHKAENCVLTSKGNPNAHLPLMVEGGSYIGLKFKGERTGFITLKIDCIEDTELMVTWSETLEADGSVNYRRLGSSVLYYELKGGTSYTLISAEPYSLHYANIIATRGNVNVKSFGVIRADFNASEINVSLSKKADDQIVRIYNAAIETFRQNTFDIYMDCPSRERAGWLCDSFFTSRVEKLMSGKSTVEKCFLANFAMDENPKYLPDGMLPMCYPSDHRDGAFIPNWAMWYVVELNEYLNRTGDREFIDEMKDRMYRLLKYFRRFENSDGLLEKLESWVFVEWSMSNKLVQDINYPSNMLYAMFKRILGNLYNDAALISEADSLRVTIREKSRVGNFFCDNSVYNEDGVAVLSGECTESCQYYAFFCGIATPEEDAELWNILLNDFGPDRKINNKWPKIHFANAFIGNYLRLDLLMREGEKEKLEENIRGYFDYMALRTGTLWENDTPHASCNHGFASHVLIWLDYLGYID